jgi:TRAP-type C4-dicarboxylate transport system permease small subunit
MRAFIELLKVLYRKPVEFVCGLLMAAITGVVFLQVISRYVFRHPFDWPEELARFLFVWVALLGAALALRRGAHFSIEILVHRFSKRWQLITALFIHSLLGLFILIVTIKGFELAIRIREQLSSGIEISMTIPYLAVPVSFAVMLKYIFADIFKLIKRQRYSEPEL